MTERFKMMEGDRKSLYESTQFNIRQNRDTLGAVKKENKDLRSALAALAKDQARSDNRGSGLVRLEQEVNELRRKHDELKHANKAKGDELTKLNDKLQELEKDAARMSNEDTPLTRQIRTLENRLDKAMIKYNEAQSIRKTYEQIVKRLKEERIGFDNQIAAIERTLKAKEKDLEELVLMSHDAQHAKEVAKGELLKLEHTLTEERKQREKELGERRALVQQKVEMNQRMEKREKMRREIALESAGDLSAEGETQLKKSLFSTAFHSALNETKLEEEQEKITTYEEAFRKIKDATGVSDVNEVIQKFLTQDETHNNLVAMTKEAQGRIDQLNEEKNQAKSKVEEIKYSGTGSLGSRRIVDEFESHLSEASGKCERNKQKYERIAKILINVKAGVEHLADKLELIKLDIPAVALTDDTVVDVLGQCESKLSVLMEKCGVAEQGVEEPKTEEVAPEVDMPPYNIRINLPNDAEDDSDEELEEEDQEDVPDRDAVKKYSALMLEKANRKQRRGQRRKKTGKEGTRGAVSKGRRADMD